MLNQARGLNNGLAWLLAENHRQVLIVQGRAPVPSLTGLCFYAPDFGLTESQPWLIGQPSDFVQNKQVPLPAISHNAKPSSAAFARLHEEILALIVDGRFEKVVPMVCEEFEFESEIRRDMFRAPILPFQYAYGFDFESEGMAGVTPEVLFEVDRGELKTMALAGTGRANGPSLLEDRKEMHEHHLVIEHIHSELKEFGRIETGATVERIFGPLKHLYTPLQVKLEQAPRFEELVSRLHPTAALGGWPRKSAVEWLEQQSFHRKRARFGAPFGFADGDRMMCVVAIRNVQWWGRRLQVSTGCGVVKESQALKEWQELALKRQAIVRALGVEL